MAREKKVKLDKVLTSNELVSYRKARFDKYRKRLKYFLQVNKLFLQLEKGEEIEVSTDATYRVEENEFGDQILIVKFYKTSSYDIDQRLKKVANSLSTLFQSDLGEVKDELAYVEYSLILKPSKDLETEEFTKNVDRLDRSYISLNQRFKLDLNRYPHLLLTGATRSGKTIYLTHLLMEMLRINATGIDDNEFIFICDGKGLELVDYCRQLDLKVASGYADILLTVEKVHRIMKQRQENGERYEQRIFLVLDEFSSIQESFPLDKEGKENKKRFMQLVADIIRLGGSCNVSCFIGNQVSNTDRIPSELKNNILTRLNLGKIVSGDQWRVLFGQEEQIEVSIPGPGHGILYDENGLHKFVAPRILMQEY